MPGRSPWSGFRALAAGGAVIALLVPALRPAFGMRCPPTGNASLFADPAWDSRLTLLVVSWVLLVAVEQALPPTWRGRRPAAVIARAAVAVSLALLSMCGLVVAVTAACH